MTLFSGCGPPGHPVSTASGTRRRAGCGAGVHGSRLPCRGPVAHDGIRGQILGIGTTRLDPHARLALRSRFHPLVDVETELLRLVEIPEVAIAQRAALRAGEGLDRHHPFPFHAEHDVAEVGATQRPQLPLDARALRLLVFDLAPGAGRSEPALRLDLAHPRTDAENVDDRRTPLRTASFLSTHVCQRRAWSAVTLRRPKTRRGKQDREESCRCGPAHWIATTRRCRSSLPAVIRTM